MRSTYGNLQGILGKSKEHLRAPSPINNHANIRSYHTMVDNLSIVGRESHNSTRTIKEAMYIRVRSIP